MKLFKRIIDRYLNLQFKTKLTISYIILIVVPLSILGIGYYNKSSDIILQNARENILNIIKRSNETLNARFILAENSAIFMHIDEDLFEIFSNFDGLDLNNHNKYMEADRRITKTILKYFPFSEDIYSVNIVTRQFTFGQDLPFWIPKNGFSNSNVYSVGLESKDRLKWIPTYDLLEEFDIREKEQLSLKRHSQYVFSAVRLLNSAIIRNNLLVTMNKEIERPVLIINFKEEMLKKTFKESTYIEGSYYYVLTKNGDVVSHSDSAEPVSFNNTQWWNDIITKGSGTNFIYINGKKMLVCFDTMNITGWISVVFVPYDKLLKTLPTMHLYTFYMTMVIILISAVLASFISGRVTLPIKKLLLAIKSMGEGNFNSKVEEMGNGELSYLIYKFNEMNDKIQRLIEENYQVKIKEKEAEIKALNFQFNPHFMYNTLNIINWMAIENNQEEISKMLVNLSEMLEYTAKDHKGMINFMEDMEYLKSYVYIMMKRFVGRFAVQYDIDPQLYNYDVPKFFLQPFIENALIHGFEEIEEGGLIKISGWIEDNKRYFCVEDNGKGMSAEKIKEIMEIEEESAGSDKSIGIDNVNKRVQLLYGKQYGVHIESELYKGTKITIIIPLESTT
ncbi:sensor histidine kinase [Petroclostridium xylanilyticum]|uniref:sensor histidine kinase n=1 Tax=Petroclostridium xylanilyticum TaxID=1792311 RepID=UPI000B99C1E5|nr:sensor histidine kinase [Petroclostridium xylanilyticum]